MMRHEQRIVESRTASEEKLNPTTTTTTHCTTINNSLIANNTSAVVSVDKQNGYNNIRSPLDLPPDSPSIKRRSKHVAKLNMGESKDDIHVCIMCMRAIMNNKVSISLGNNVKINWI